MNIALIIAGGRGMRMGQEIPKQFLTVYDKPVIAVDTHVFRVSHRLGLSDGKTPEAVERDLERHIPVPDRAISHHWLILHGRYVCTALKPKCAECPLTAWCKDFAERGK